MARTLTRWALDMLAAGRQAIILIDGEAGIGKSRLLSEAVGQARRRGFQLALGRGEELEQTRPFGVVAEAFECMRSSPDPRRAAIAALLATHSEAENRPITVRSDPGLRFRAVDAFVDLVEDLALNCPCAPRVRPLPCRCCWRKRSPPACWPTTGPGYDSGTT